MTVWKDGNMSLCSSFLFRTSCNVCAAAAGLNSSFW